MRSRAFLWIPLLILLALALSSCGEKLPEGCPPNCEGADLYQFKLGDVDLHGANLKGADLSRSMLRGANLTGADLTGAGLRYADLRGADLSNAILVDADLRFAQLKGVNFTGAQLDGANLLNATHRPSTIWPEGFDYKKAGAVLAPED